MPRRNISNSQKPRYIFPDNSIDITLHERYTSHYMHRKTLESKSAIFMPISQGACDIGNSFRIGQVVIANHKMAWGHVYDYFYTPENNADTYLKAFEKYSEKLPVYSVVPYVNIDFMMSAGDRVNSLRKFMTRVRSRIGRFPVIVVSQKNLCEYGLDSLSAYANVIIAKFSNEPLLIEDLGSWADSGMIVGRLDRYKCGTVKGKFYADDINKKWQELAVLIYE